MSDMTQKIDGTAANWENEVLGNDEQFAVIAEGVTSESVDDTLALQMISIRLQKSMIQDLKNIAKANNLGGYQPLIRRILERFVEAEMKTIAREAMANSNQTEVTYERERAIAC
ncbi:MULTISPECIES: hypothetical protein [Shewanella]|mgnify:CR=1 FL=1|uniref:Uncharacterized protein n=1 Tax=Shewanella putrefaciens TaxID=24 RepID=A0ABX8X7E0_SHEPU|nr:hypothetical protein [Shewanella putrefaciens]AVV81963.1 hypothetical protein SPWS13_0092 [Shewanella putrefaciens]MCT8943745.1 hypothetical protein [Shewanella putrefaciens]QSE47964.1 hypothetical protein JW975_11195 [Shewanella putrefaciens]QYX71367.1 hypothetical protein K3G22_11185 [Shewanella putrefaciens]GGN23364.1 hypothetical protein GCM10007984_24050 [Shewanella putrefaciens]